MRGSCKSATKVGATQEAEAARDSADKKAARDAEDRYGKITAWKTELGAFIAAVEQCAEKGPPPGDTKTPAREADARYAPDLDDGVMINSAALWPPLEPQWKDPNKWWNEPKQATLDFGESPEEVNE